MPSVPTRSGLAITLFVLGLGACAADDDPQLGESEQNLILGSEDWNQLPSFEADPLYFRGALYGRATANLSLSDGARCSGWLITDNILVTANHCRAGNNLTATFGRYDSSPGSNANGVADARARLGELGLASASVTDAQLTTFTCSLYESDYPSSSRDVDYYLCAPNNVTLNLTPFGRNRTFELHPGDLWGQYELDLGGRSDDHDVYAISVNKTNAQDSAGQANSVLLSPNGWIYDGDDDWYGPYAHNFEFVGADIVCGSSGGVVLDESNHRAFGLISGQYGDSDGCTRTSHGNSGLQYSNIGTYLGSFASTLTGYGASYDAVPKVGTHDTAYVGGNGGTQRILVCPNQFVATGVIGTRINGVIGNFGLICSPFRHGYSTTTGADATLFRDFQHSTVIAGGSIDTGFQVANNADYNTYWHEVMPNNDATTPQAQLMCPYGSYLSGATVSRFNALVSGIDSIRCTELKKVGSNVEARVTTRTSTGLAGPTSTKQSALCNANSYVTGLVERSGYFTDGFQFGCTQLYGTAGVPAPNPN